MEVYVKPNFVGKDCSSWGDNRKPIYYKKKTSKWVTKFIVKVLIKIKDVRLICYHVCLQSQICLVNNLVILLVLFM